MKIHTPPVRVQLISHPTGTTFGEPADAIGSANIAATTAGQTRSATNFTRARPSTAEAPIA
ncbi:hypothetical protein A5764_19510 [Mycobacterium sp. 852002-51057_SCH5723018]|nr:hypothetical protein A5764_19510 [Mycobacterium sp. 852002-51057_SCH5723018]